MTSFKPISQGLLTQTGPNLLQPAACLAAQKHQHEILSYCLEQGAVFDKYLQRAAQMGANSLAMLELLLEADWAGIREDKEAVTRQVEHFGEESFQAKWLLSHAGKGKPELKTRMPEMLKEEDAEPAEQRPLGKKKKKGNSGGRDPSKGKGSKDPKQGPSPDEIHKWFGNVPW
jgi:hypothetical protein